MFLYTKEKLLQIVSRLHLYGWKLDLTFDMSWNDVSIVYCKYPNTKQTFQGGSNLYFVIKKLWDTHMC